MRRRAGWMLAAAAALLAPCWWQKRIIAGDLSSHIYNAWLAQLIERGAAPGLVIHPQFTNVAFDWLLAGLFRVAGPDLAQRIAVSLVMLIFGAGVWVLLTAVARRPPVFLVPFILILAHGWIYHAGFFNYLASTGLVLMAFGLIIRRQSVARWLGAGVLAVTAVAFHLYPVIAVGGLALYWFAARRLHYRKRWWLLAAGVAAIVVTREILLWRFGALWLPRQYISAFGADQLWVFGQSSYAMVAGCLIAWRFLYYRIGEVSIQEVLRRVSTQLILLAAAVALILPGVIGAFGDHLGFTSVAERTSLVIAVLVLLFFARVRPARMDVVTAWGLCAAFHGLMFAEGLRLNQIEDRVDRAVAQLAPGTRVVGTRAQERANTDQVVHMADRACIGHCYSFANYEPGTAIFRVRVTGDSPVVVSDYADSVLMQAGMFKQVRSKWDYKVMRVSAAGHVTIANE